MKLCVTDGCLSKPHAKGFCQKHYKRDRAGSSLNGKRPHEKTLQERFDEKVDKSGECWVWTGGKVRGYGRIKANGKARIAHRLSYEMHVGEIRQGLQVLHECDNPSCVNPKHLFQGTQKDNVEDMYNKGRENPPQGVKNGRVKLSEAEVLEIRDLYPLFTQSEIGLMFNVDQSTIHLIVKRKNWKHLKQK